MNFQHKPLGLSFCCNNWLVLSFLFMFAFWIKITPTYLPTYLLVEGNNTQLTIVNDNWLSRTWIKGEERFDHPWKKQANKHASVIFRLTKKKN